MFEIANEVGIPIEVDEAIRSRLFRYFVRLLVNIDLAKVLYKKMMVKRDEFAFMIETCYINYFYCDIV